MRIKSILVNLPAPAVTQSKRTPIASAYGCSRLGKLVCCSGMRAFGAVCSRVLKNPAGHADPALREKHLFADSSSIFPLTTARCASILG